MTLMSQRNFPMSKISDPLNSLCIIPLPNRQNLTGLEASHTGLCHKSLHDQINIVSSMM